MSTDLIDAQAFTDLQHSAGADFVAELVATFGEEAPLLLDELRAAQAEGAAERFRRAAHSLKSNGHTFGATRLAEMARTIKLGGVPASAAPVRLLAEEFERTLVALKAMAAGANPWWTPARARDHASTCTSLRAGVGQPSTTA